MRKVNIESSSGPATVGYTISTPQNNDAEAIDPSIPTIIFLHPIYVLQVVFYHQFGNPDLRRFNLIALDARCHGITVGAVPSTYRLPEAAEDVMCVMEALNLPPCHIFGLSFGSCIALELAIAYPERVLSVLMLSPIPLVEPESVAAGRQEIYDCWVESFQNPEAFNEEASLDSLSGALQLGVNQKPTKYIDAMVAYTFPFIAKAWSREHFEEFHTISVKMFLQRDPHPISTLQKITCPVYIMHCVEDIAYPIEFAEEMRDRLKEAGIDVRFSQIPDAPHFGCATHPDLINKIYYEWVKSLSGNIEFPPAKAPVVSPYEEDLVNCGLVIDTPEPSDSEDDLIVVQ